MRLLHSNRAFIPVSAILVCLVFLTGCKLLIPENPSADRYNTVIGGRHAPELNRASERGQAPDQSVSPQSSAAPMGRSAASYPPAGPQTQAMANNAPPEQTRSMWDRMAFWRADEPAASSSAPPPIPRANGRQVPIENAQLATNYPSVNDIPPNPQAGGAQSTADQLSRVRYQLEQDRMNSTNAGARLNSDAASEPMLAPMPSGTAPMPGPVMQAPLPPPSGNRMAPQGANYMMLPPPLPLASSGAPYQQPAYAAAPAPYQSYAAAPIPSGMGYAPTPYAQPQPQQQAALEPIILHPPTTAGSLPPSYQVAGAPRPQAPTTPGGFDPMASPAYGSSPYARGYLPDSRYATRRDGQ